MTVLEPPVQLKKSSENYVYSFTVFPDALNYSGSLFGGRLLSEMDLAASNAVRKILYDTPCNGLVTVLVSEVHFKSPGKLGDIIEINCHISKLGTTSITVDVVVSKEDQTGVTATICSSRFTFVALRDGKPYPHNKVKDGN